MIIHYRDSLNQSSCIQYMQSQVRGGGRLFPPGVGEGGSVLPGRQRLTQLFIQANQIQNRVGVLCRYVQHCKKIKSANANQSRSLVEINSILAQYCKNSLKTLIHQFSKMNCDGPVTLDEPFCSLDCAVQPTQIHFTPRCNNASAISYRPMLWLAVSVTFSSVRSRHSIENDGNKAAWQLFVLTYLLFGEQYGLPAQMLQCSICVSIYPLNLYDCGPC